MLESAMKGPVMKKLKQNISDYQRNKLNTEQAAASDALKNLKFEQQRMIPTKKSKYQTHQKNLISTTTETDSLITET